MDNIILSEKIKVSTDSKITQLNNNVCILGCTGSGKTYSYIIPQILENFERNPIIYDPKRELVDTYSPLYESRGIKTYELNLSEPSRSTVSFDPLCYVSSDEDISTLATAIINLTEQRPNSTADRYWEDAAVVLAKFGLYYVLSTKENATFADFIDFIVKEIKIEDGYSLIKTSVDDQMEIIKREKPNHPMIEPYESFKVLPIKTAGCVFSELRTTLTAVFNQGLKDMFRNKQSLDLRKFARERSALFISANGSNSYLGSFKNMVFDICINELTKIADTYTQKALPIPVNLIMDDFGCSGGVIKAFPDYIARMRSKNISASIVLQDQSQLKAKYGEYEGRTIMNNCDTILYLGGNDIQTAKDISERLNLPLDRVLYMSLGDIIVFRRGQAPCIDKRYPTLEDKEYKKAMQLAEKRINEKNKDEIK